MPRVKRGTKARKRRKKILKQASGYTGRRKNTYRRAVEAVERALAYAYRDRRQKKRDFRALWIARISAGLEGTGLTYSRFIAALKKSDIGLNRKILAQLAAQDKNAFTEVVKAAQTQ